MHNINILRSYVRKLCSGLITKQAHSVGDKQARYSSDAVDSDTDCGTAQNKAFASDSVQASPAMTARVVSNLRGAKVALVCKSLFAAIVFSLGMSCFITDVQAAPLKTRPYTNAMHGVKLRVLVETKNPPFAILSKDVTHPEGFDIDVIYDLQRRLGFELEENRFYPVDVQKGFQMMEEGSGDVLVGGLVMNDDRMKIADVTSVIYSTGLSIMYSTKFTAVESPGDMDGKRLGVKFESPAEAYIRGVTTNVPIVYNNIIMAYYAVSTGKIDAVVADRPSLTYFSKLIPDFNLAVSDAVFDFYSGQFVFYLSKHNEYKDLFNQALADMQADGTIYKLRRKWITE